MSAPISNTAECYDEPGPDYDFEDVEMPEEREPYTDPMLLVPSRLSARECQRGIDAIRGGALTVSTTRDRYVQRELLDAFARRGLRAWVAGNGYVVALGEDESLALDRLECAQAAAPAAATARAFDLVLGPLSAAQGATLTEAAA